MFFFTNIALFMSLGGRNGGCIRCRHDRLRSIRFLYLSPNPCFLTGLCYDLNTSVWELLLEGRKERGRIEGALNSERSSKLFWVLSVCEKCVGTLTSYSR